MTDQTRIVEMKWHLEYVAQIEDEGVTLAIAPSGVNKWMFWGCDGYGDIFFESQPIYKDQQEAMDAAAKWFYLTALPKFNAEGRDSDNWHLFR